MGRDKALLPFAGAPLITHMLSILREAGLTASIAGARSASLKNYAPVVADAKADLGPLAGICAALSATAARFAVIVPVDLPLLPASLLAYLVRRARITGSAVTVPMVSGFAQTFPSVLDRAALPALEGELNAGRRGCFSAFQAAASSLRQPVAGVAVEFLAQCGQAAHPRGLPPSRWFANVNSPADLERAQALCL